VSPAKVSIALVMAMREEAAPIIQRLGLQSFQSERFRDLQFQFFRGSVHETFDVTLVLPGLDPRFKMDAIGTEPAAVCAFAVINEFKPDLLLNAGTCGSFAAEGASIGKVYFSKSAFYFHDHRIPLDGWREFGQGAYPSLDVTSLASYLGVETANVSSGNALDYTSAELETMKANGAILKEMEAGGIAWVSFITKTPFFAIKSVTNLIDTHPDSPTEFEKNFGVAVASLADHVVALFKALSRGTGAEWLLRAGILPSQNPT
jgi:nucleoside phosphorylase